MLRQSSLYCDVCTLKLTDDVSCTMTIFACRAAYHNEGKARAKKQNNKMLEALHDDPNITRDEVIGFTKDLQEEGKLAKQAAQNALDDNNNAIAVMESETRLEIATVVRKYNHTKTTRKLEILDGAAKVEARNKKNKGDHYSNKDAHEIVYGPEGQRLLGGETPPTGGTTNGGATQGAAPAAGQPLPPQLPGEVFRSTFNKRTTKDDNNNDVIDLTHTKSNFGCTATAPAG